MTDKNEIMKPKLLFLFLILTLNSSAQGTTIIRNPSVCQAFWQIFESDSLLFVFQKINGEILDFQSVIYHVDTAINPLSCDPVDFNVEPYFINENPFSCNEISKITFYYQNERIKKIGFYITIYDDQGNYIGDELLFLAIYK